MRGGLGVRLAALGLACAFAVESRAAAPPADERKPAARPSRQEGDYDAPQPRWREGPVRYLLSKDEDDTFRALATDEARAEFIQRFWASRDPVASTPENEYRALFYSRVAEANRRFTDSTKPGWKTDRGKIFILLGPPDDSEQDQLRDEFAPDVITWIYRAPRSGVRIDVLPVVRFIRDATGEYRLSTRVMLPGFETTTGIAFQIQAMQMKSLPEQRKLLDSIVGERPSPAAERLRAHADFFPSSERNTLAIITLVVHPGPPAAAAPAPIPAPGDPPPAAPARYEALARLVGVKDGSPTYDFAGPSSLRGGPEGPAKDASGSLLFQGALPVPPGSYTAYYGVVDHATGEVTSTRDTLEVPDLGAERFMLSRISLASSVEGVAGSRTTYTTPFVLGDLRVLPHPDDLFHVGESFAFYYEIYGPANDPIDGRPDLDLEYRFFVAEDDGGGLKFTPLGKPISLTRQRSQVQGYALPLRDWTPGIYRLRVQVKDNLTELQSTEEVSFRVQ